MLMAKFEEDCARFTAVRGSMVKALAAQHASGLQRQAAALRDLQRDLHGLQADMDGVKHGLMEQLDAIESRSKPHWKFVPLQRKASRAETEAAVAMQKAWRRKAHGKPRGWHYMPPAERWALVHDPDVAGVG